MRSRDEAPGVAVGVEGFVRLHEAVTLRLVVCRGGGHRLGLGYGVALPFLNHQNQARQAGAIRRSVFRPSQHQERFVRSDP